MPAARKLQPLPVPLGDRALEIVPALRDALDGTGPALLPVPAQDPARASRIADALDAANPLGADEDSPDDPTALVIATSGSTGQPKGVLLSAAALRASAEATHRRLHGPGSWLLALPANHIAGIQVLVRALLAGRPVEAVDTTDGFRPDRFTTAARRVLQDSGPHYTSLVPTQLTRLLNSPEEGLAELRKFDAVLVGGAAAPPDLLNRAAEADVQVVTTYGMSETAGGCVYDGQPLDITDVELDTSGRISLAGPMLARGYRNHPGSDAFQDGWFRTGDLGRWRDGRLEVLGRADDLIITGGVNVAPLPIERVLSAQQGVREVCVLGVPHPEWGQAVIAAVVPTDPDSPPDRTALQSAVREQLGAPSVPKHVLFLPELPLRGPGKPDRRALSALFRS